jgi:hypothetical protein
MMETILYGLALLGGVAAVIVPYFVTEGGECGCSVGSNWNGCGTCNQGGTSCSVTEAGCGFLGWYKCDGACGPSESD